MSPAPTSGLSYPLCSWARRRRQADTSGVSEEFSGEGAALLAVARRRVLLAGLSSAGSDGASPDCGSGGSSDVAAPFFSAFLPVFFPDFLSALSPFFSLVFFADFKHGVDDVAFAVVNAAEGENLLGDANLRAGKAHAAHVVHGF